MGESEAVRGALPEKVTFNWAECGIPSFASPLKTAVLAPLVWAPPSNSQAILPRLS